MNIFYLDKDPKTAARYHCDKHISKLAVEYAQLLSTAHHILDGDTEFTKKLYKKTHINHPSAIWARTNRSHYEWLYTLFIETCSEYTERYNKIHLTYKKLADLLKNAPNNIPDGEFSDPPRCMPEHCKIDDDVVASYRNYYILEKSKFAKWSYSNTPIWFKEGIKNL